MSPLYKTTIIIWTEWNPATSNIEMSELVKEAEDGDAYCSDYIIVKVNEPTKDNDWDGTDFFDDED